MRRRIIAFIGVAAFLGCGGSGPCPTPAGCRSAGRVDGACACLAWETASTEAVALPYVVTGVTYEPAGGATLLGYGTTDDPSQVPASASSLGTSVRVLIRRPDGSEQVARVGNIDAFSLAERTSPTTLRIASGGRRTIRALADVSTPAADGVAVWANPAPTVRTDHAGEKWVDWAIAPRCLLPGLACNLPQVMSFPVRLLRGEVLGDAWYEAYLSEAAGRRSELLTFDGRLRGAPAYPRYQWLGSIDLGDAQAVPVDATWLPCTSPEAFTALAETVVPLRDGETFVLQYGVQVDAACTAQRPGLLARTGTPGCSLWTNVYVDRLAGTLLMEPTIASAACTTR